MSYLLLARKYRPQTFDAVISQAHVTRTLRNALASGRQAHAYLFSGPRGVGKTTLARLLAKGLHCEKAPTGDPCNVCEGCRAIAEARSLDYQEIDGASNRGIDQIRELNASLGYASPNQKHRVFVIDEVHMLTTEAFNALLKSLEEPPPKVLFVFCTTEVHKVPVTIRSRCQHYVFKAFTPRSATNSRS
jgi:DNA polymerase-3 subunit gamma/tau